MIEEFKRWKPIIATKRKQSPDTKHYDEFEKLCNSLEKLRSKTERNKKFSQYWLLACLLSLVLATFVYWEPHLFSSPYLDKGYTAVNVLVSMSTSGIVVFLYRLPKIRQLQNCMLKNCCYGVIFICIIVNAVLSFLDTTNLLNYIMIIVTGIGTGGVALLFSVYNTEMDDQDGTPLKQATSDEGENKT